MLQKLWLEPGKIDRAAAEAMKAVEANPASAAARGFHALTLSELGHDEEAIKEAERAIELSPADSAAHLQSRNFRKAY